MKKYQILESWHNRCDNAVCELYAECRNENDTREILDALSKKFEKEGLGDGFPSLSEGYELVSQFYDNIADFWLQKNDEGFMSSEYRRRFQVIVETVEDTKELFILTETEANEPSYSYSELFPSVVKARERMKHLYHENAIEKDINTITKADWQEGKDTAFVEYEDGNSIHWSISKAESIGPIPHRWDFVHEQESLNPAFYGFYTGIISNGKDFLFFRANREDNLCEVFGSIEEMGEDDSELFALCSYPWTAENDSLLLSVLNNTPFEDVYTYGTCDQSKSILKTIEFKK